MDEPDFWFELGVGSVLAMFGWLGKRAVARVDQLETEIENLSRAAITKAELRDELDSNSKTIVEAIQRVARDVEIGQRDVIARIGVVDAKAEKVQARLDAIKDEEIQRLRLQAERHA